MIAADVALIDLEPEGFARICTLASRAQSATEHTVSVLHENGAVVGVHDSTGTLVAAQALEPFSDAGRRAIELRSICGAARVVLYDRTRTDDLAARLVEFARPDATQLEAFWANHQAFWSSPAIATDPAPPVNRWSTLTDRLAPLGDDWWALLALYDGADCEASLLAHVGGGLVDVVTSLDHLGAGVVRPQRDAAEQLLDQAGQLGRIELVLVCGTEEFAAALLEPDVPGALADIDAGGRAIVTRNLQLLRAAT